MKKWVMVICMLNSTLVAMEKPEKNKLKIAAAVLKNHQEQESCNKICSHEGTNVYSHTLINPEGKRVAYFWSTEPNLLLPQEARDEYGNLKQGWISRSVLLE